MSVSERESERYARAQPLETLWSLQHQNTGGTCAFTLRPSTRLSCSCPQLPKYTPGPGAYKHIITTGKQHESKLRTAPKFGFGTAERFDKSVQKREAGVPGPGAYLI